MFDELDTLRDSTDLQRLLDHYVEVCAADSEYSWTGGWRWKVSRSAIW